MLRKKWAFDPSMSQNSLHAYAWVWAYVQPVWAWSSVGFYLHAQAHAQSRVEVHKILKHAAERAMVTGIVGRYVLEKLHVGLSLYNNQVLLISKQCFTFLISNALQR